MYCMWRRRRFVTLDAMRKFDRLAQLVRQIDALQLSRPAGPVPRQAPAARASPVLRCVLLGRSRAASGVELPSSLVMIPDVTADPVAALSTPASARFRARRDCAHARGSLGRQRMPRARSANRPGCRSSVRKGKVETIEHKRDKGLGITVYSASAAATRRPRILPGRRSSKRSRRRTTSRASPPKTRPRACPTPTRSQRSPRDLDLFHPWDSTPTKQSSSRSVAKPRRSRSARRS